MLAMVPHFIYLQGFYYPIMELFAMVALIKSFTFIYVPFIKDTIQILGFGLNL